MMSDSTLNLAGAGPPKRRDGPSVCRSIRRVPIGGIDCQHLSFTDPKLSGGCSSVARVEGLRALTGREVVDVLKERYANAARQRAALLEAVWETVICDDADSLHRLTDPDEWSADEVRAALGLTRRGAQLLVNEAHAVVHRLPKLHEAMAAGQLDPGRARVFMDWTLELTDEHARQVVDALLPKCDLAAQTRMTTGQLADEVKTMAVTLDPNWAERRYEGKLEERRVIATREPEGTASLSGKHLPVERVAASKERIERLARAARRAGDKRPIDHIRADLYLGMTDGTYEGLRAEQIIAALLAAGDVEATCADVTAAMDDQGGLWKAEPEAASTAEPMPEQEPMPEPEPSWAGVHLRARLTTLLGLDRYPAELAGWGTCHAELAVQMVRQLGAAQWRYIFTCPDGYLLDTGLLRSRPSGSRKRKATCEAVVEIVVPAGLLPRLFGPDGADLQGTVAPDLLKAWDAVLADLHDKLTEPSMARLLDPRRRVPGAALRREVIAAIDTCIGAGCRAPARSADIDHLHDHSQGGDTVKENLEPMCRHDHRVKTEAGWQLRRVADTFEWTTRLGHVYLVPISPVLPKHPPPEPRSTAPPTWSKKWWESRATLPPDPDAPPPPF